MSRYGVLVPFALYLGLAVLLIAVLVLTKPLLRLRRSVRRTMVAQARLQAGITDSTGLLRARGAALGVAVRQRMPRRIRGQRRQHHNQEDRRG